MTEKREPGPSPQYRELLEGKITPEEYVKKLKRAVTAERVVDQLLLELERGGRAWRFRLPHGRRRRPAATG